MIEIPNFTVERELGRGGMATVYLAVQDMLSRNVALKVMLPDMARDENFRKSFLSEGKIIANLEHPNIVRIHDFGIIDDSILYMAMEYLGDGTLKEKLADGELPYEKAVKIIEDTSAGLSYAHAKGYIHRDIKPGNILFRDDGTAVITDFGIAKLQDTSGELTRMGYTMGTVQYMSPEQAVTTDLDHRSDIYSLGLVFYEMLTGQKAFKAESTIQAIHQHTTVAPPALPLKYSYLQPIIDKVLAKEPDDRYQNINDFVNAVKNAKEEDVTVIHRVSSQIDDDSTQILRTGHYQVDDLDKTRINIPSTNQASKKGKGGLLAGITAGLVLIGGLAFGITKYPEINTWLNKEDTTNQQKLLETQKTLEEEKERLALEAQKILEDKERAKIQAEKEEQERIKKERDKQRQIAEAELRKLEAEKLERDRIIAEKIASAKKQAEQDKKNVESERQREIAEAELQKLKAEKAEKDKALALQIASAKKQAEEDRIRAEAQLKKIEDERKERERKLAEQIAKAKKQAEEVEKARILAEQQRLEADKREKERILAEQITKAKKQAEEAEKARILAEQERIEAYKKEKERILAEQIAKAKKQAEEAEKARILAEQEKIEADKKEKERLIAEQNALAKRQAEQDRLAKEELERKKQEELDLAIAEKKKLEEEKQKKEQLRKEQEKLDAEIAAQRKLKEAKLEKERIAKQKKAAEQKRKEKLAQEKKAKLALAKKKARDAQRKKDLARKKIEQEKKRKAALAAKKKADAIRRQQQQANSRGQIRVSATLNGRPYNTTFVVTRNGKKVQTIGGRAAANFVLPVGRYVIATQYSGKVARANVDLQPRDIVSQSFAFKGGAPAKPVNAQKDWTHEHKY